MVVTGLAIFGAVSLSGLSCWAQFGSGAESYGGGYGRYGGGIAGPMQPGMGMNPPPGMNPNDPLVKSQMEMSQALGDAIGEFRRAQGDDAKAAAQKKLVEALTKYFDADMKGREAGLQKVEAQVKLLRSQLDKRAGKKQEIIDLQIKLLENEADGLGFFGSPPGLPGMVPGMMGEPMTPGGPFGAVRNPSGVSFGGSQNSPKPAATPPVAPTLGTSNGPPLIAPTESEQDDANTPRVRQ